MKRDCWASGKVITQKYRDGKMYIVIRMGAKQYYFRPRTPRQHVYFMALKDKVRRFLFDILDDTLMTIHVKWNGPYNKRVDAARRRTKTEEYRRYAEDDKLELEAQRERMGTDSRHTSRVMKAAEHERRMSKSKKIRKRSANRHDHVSDL